MSLTERIRAGRPSAAAPFRPVVMHVVVVGEPVGRTVAVREPMSPFMRQARAGTLRPAVLTTPIEGGDA